MEETKLKGRLYLEEDSEDELDNEMWIIYDENDKRTWLDPILSEFESHEVEIIIRSLKPPSRPPQ